MVFPFVYEAFTLMLTKQTTQLLLFYNEKLQATVNKIRIVGATTSGALYDIKKMFLSVELASEKTIRLSNAQR